MTEQPIRLAFIAFMAFIACKEAGAIAIQLCTTCDLENTVLHRRSSLLLPATLPHSWRGPTAASDASCCCSLPHITLYNPAPRRCRRGERLYKEAFIAFMAFIASQTPKVERFQWFKVKAQPFFLSRVDMFSHLGQVESSSKLD